MAQPTGTRFYALEDNANYSPWSNPVYHATATCTSGSATVTVSHRDALLIDGLVTTAAARNGCSGLQVVGVLSTTDFVTINSVNTSTDELTISTNSDLNGSVFIQFWFGGIPNEQQPAISAVLCTNNVGELSFYDANGALITFTDTLVKGAVYNFVIQRTVVADAGVFVGISE